MQSYYATQPLLCAVGIHVVPPSRVPRGPIVAACACCGEVAFYYGMTDGGLTSYPQLVLPTIPKVVGPVALIRP